MSSAAAVQSTSVVRVLESEIGIRRNELNKLEAAFALLVKKEPVVNRTRSTGKRRRFQATGTTSTDAPAKRKRGRPVGSKNRPKVTVTTSGEPVPVEPTTESVSEASVDTPVSV